MDYAELIGAIQRHLDGQHRDRPADTKHLLSAAALAKLDSLATHEQRTKLREQEKSLHSLMRTDV